MVNDIILKSEVRIADAMSRCILLLNMLKNQHYVNNPNGNWDCFFLVKEFLNDRLYYKF